MSLSNSELAQILFPDVTDTIADIQSRYPSRPDGQLVLRMAPSPTGFFHIGNLFTGVVNERIAHQDGGVFFLRIEDTDQARKVEGAVEAIVYNMRYLGLTIDEGPIGPDMNDVGSYGPYTQSERHYLYKVFAKYLVEQGLAYPCWMTTEQMESIREEQMKLKKAPGIYGNYALWRNKTNDEYAIQFAQDKNCTLRFRAHGDTTRRVVFDDINRGKVSMMDNPNDMVLLKGGLSLPTYHLAHIVDDHLMGTTHVTRGEEWLTSVPFHLQLFAAFGFAPPQYCHLPLILKLDEGKKRKVSKRHDPEFNIKYLYEQGYSPEGLIMFVLTLIDSGYEEWQKANPDQHYTQYRIDLHRMNSSGSLWDNDKLNHINNIYLSKISNDQLFTETFERAEQYRSDFAVLIASDPEYAKAAMSIERHTDLDPKRFSTYADVETQVRFFFDSEFAKILSDRPSRPVMITDEIARSFVEDYSQELDLSLSKEERFAQLKAIGARHGFAPNNAEYKNGGYTGKIGDLAMFLRIQLAGSTKTPDLYSMMQVMGKERVQERMSRL